MGSAIWHQLPLPLVAQPLNRIRLSIHVTLDFIGFLYGFQVIGSLLVPLGFLALPEADEQRPEESQDTADDVLN